MTDYERRVRECAYYLWQAEGRPDGRAEMHWRMAEIATALFSYLSQGVRKLPPQRHPDSYDHCNEDAR
jgi:hypothetical protein